MLPQYLKLLRHTGSEISSHLCSSASGVLDKWKKSWITLVKNDCLQLFLYIRANGMHLTLEVFPSSVYAFLPTLWKFPYCRRKPFFGGAPQKMVRTHPHVSISQARLRQPAESVG